MTCVPLGRERWRLEFSESESLFLATILSQLAHHYRQDLDDLPEALQEYWREPESADPADEDKEGSREILSEMRQELRSERLVLVENWLRNYEEAGKHDPWTVELNLAEKDDFIAMLNDRRLLLARQFELVEKDVEQESEEKMSEDRRVALWEINILGHLIFVLIGPQIYQP